MPTVVITGCNSGIGYAFAKILLKDGYKTFATSRTNGTKLKELAGLGATTAVLDVGRKESIDAFKEDYIGTQDVHLLINNAVYFDFTADESLEGVSYENMEQAFRVNTLGPFFLTRALLPNLEAGTSAKAPSTIAMITSRAASMGDGPGGGQYSYRVTKAGMNMLGVNMAADLKPKNVATVIVHPGMVYTDSVSKHFPRSPQLVEPDFAAQKCLDQIKEHGNMEETGKFWHRDGMELPW